MGPKAVKPDGGYAETSSFDSPHLGYRLGLFLARSPLGLLIRWVAGIRASVHTKLLCAFLTVAVLFIGTAAVSLQTVRGIAHQSRLLDGLHERVDLSRQIEHALAMQMNYTAMALILRNEAAIIKILRQNNLFNDKLAQIEIAAPPAEYELIEQIRIAQDQLLVVVADIANMLRDSEIEGAMQTHRQNGQPLYDQIETLVSQIVKIESDEMVKLSDSVGAAHRRAMVLIGAFAGTAIFLALALGFIISWSLILPVREAGFFLDGVAKGDFSTTISIPNRDEFGTLATHMNQMSSDLHRLYDQVDAQAVELADLNRGLEIRVNEQVTQIERLGRLRRFLSPHIADLIVQRDEDSLLESHRRQIATLFCDLRGFTAFSEAGEPEDVMRILQIYHETLGKLIHEHDGTINHRAGDGLMVIFNDPLPCQDPTRRAVLLAVAMRDHISELAADWQRLGHDLGFGVGVSFGYATLGLVGFEGCFDYTANGNAVNLASRLCDEAEDGQILLSERAYATLDNWVEVEQVGTFDLKGFNRSIAAYNVIRVRRDG
jgi:class 3 adenylate cyclase/HAMP domain-containing protein